MRTPVSNTSAKTTMPNATDMSHFMDSAVRTVVGHLKPGYAHGKLAEISIRWFDGARGKQTRVVEHVYNDTNTDHQSSTLRTPSQIGLSKDVQYPQYERIQKYPLMEQPGRREAVVS